MWSERAERHHSGRIRFKSGSIWTHTLGKKVNDSNFDESLHPLLLLRSITAPQKRVAWHIFWSLTPACSEGEGRRCWLDVSFALGDKLLREQAIFRFFKGTRCSWETASELPSCSWSRRKQLALQVVFNEKWESGNFILFDTKEPNIRYACEHANHFSDQCTLSCFPLYIIQRLSI